MYKAAPAAIDFAGAKSKVRDTEMVDMLESFYKTAKPAAEIDARYATGASEFTEILGSRVHFRDEMPTTAGSRAPTLNSTRLSKPFRRFMRRFANRRTRRLRKMHSTT